MTQYVIPRYAPMCLVLAGMIVIHIVDNFPFPTIDTITAAFSTISKQKRIASSNSDFDTQINSRPLEAKYTKDSVVVAEAHVEGEAPMLNDSYVNFDEELATTSHLEEPEQPMPYQKPAIKQLQKLVCSENAVTAPSISSPISPRPDMLLTISARESDKDDNCWSPLPSLSSKQSTIEFMSVPLSDISEITKGSHQDTNHSLSSEDDESMPSRLSTSVLEENNASISPSTETKEQNSIPRFYFRQGEPNAQRIAKERNVERLDTINRLFSMKSQFSEDKFVAVTRACSMPRYMNLALFRKMEDYGTDEDNVYADQFERCWLDLAEGCLDDDSIMFNILRKPSNSFIAPEDFLLVLEDVVCNHPGLEFLSDNALFQERYIETVICRIYYESRCASGKLTLAQFKKSKISDTLSRLERRIDLNSTHDCFSYKHFYVLYCKFWLLDQDHDLIVSESDMLQYNSQVLTSRITSRVMECGKIAAFPREPHILLNTKEATLTYMDFIWFLLSEIDKSTRTSVEYWFKCIDLDGDGIISSYELSFFWEEQEERQNLYGLGDSEMINFEDVICQLNDLIKPQVMGQFTLRDLLNSKLAERFFDTFINFHRLQIHESSHNSAKLKRQYMDALSGTDRLELDEYRPRYGTALAPEKMSDWCAYAEIEYQHLVAAERNEKIWDSMERDLEICQDEELDEEKMLTTVERLFNGEIAVKYADNLEDATQEDLEAILQKVAKTTYSSTQQLSQDSETIRELISLQETYEGAKHGSEEVRRDNRFQI
ncbi:hypothetical protein INT43_001247 [Umbelopsis isabellina]|uniref:EF-hand domain-containing protein n=1 Tax=Mortierella isabellina TaxID=91625 RepID=A0A8H7PKV8_MORIS|nr:hypothetical protein INT43_001247 [Umbelopsis isabellina]